MEEFFGYVLLLSAIACAAFVVRAMLISKRIKTNKLTSFKANPLTLYPSSFFELASESAEKLECEVEASTALTDQNAAKLGIAKSVKELTSAYASALKSRKDLPALKKRATLLKKTIAGERDCYLVDNGSDAGDFIMNRQNNFTDYLLTGITIPLILSAININASSVASLFEAVRANWVLSLTLSVFLFVLGYRVCKYFYNKMSMMNDRHRITLYNKAELMLCCFETALEEVCAASEEKN